MTKITPIAQKIKELANSKYYTTKTKYSPLSSKYLCIAARTALQFDVLKEVEGYMAQLGLHPKTALMHSLTIDLNPQTIEETLSFIKTNVYDDWDNRPATLEELQQKLTNYR